MKKITLFCTLIIVMLFACKNIATNKTMKKEIQNDNLIEADLYFGWLRIGSLYSLSDSINMDINLVLDSLEKNNTDDNSELIVLYKKLNERDLLFSPYIEVKLEDGSSAIWYLTQLDYDRIKTIKLKELEATKSKIHLSGEIEKIYENAYLCRKLVQIEKVEALNYSNTDPQFNGLDYK